MPSTEEGGGGGRADGADLHRKEKELGVERLLGRKEQGNPAEKGNRAHLANAT